MSVISLRENIFGLTIELLSEGGYMPDIRKKAKSTIDNMELKGAELKGRGAQKAKDIKSDIKPMKHETDDGFIDTNDSY